MEWNDERKAQHWRDEIRQRFEAENAVWLADEADSIAAIRADCAAEGKPAPDWLDVTNNSFLWEVYEGCEIEVENNTVKVLLPDGFAITTDVVKMFDDTMMCWSTPQIDAVKVGDDVRLQLVVYLIDYWDDERAAQWTAERQPKRTPLDEMLASLEAKADDVDYSVALPQSLLDALSADD